MGQHIPPRDNTWIPGLDGINFLSFAHEKNVFSAFLSPLQYEHKIIGIFDLHLNYGYNFFLSKEFLF